MPQSKIRVCLIWWIVFTKTKRYILISHIDTKRIPLQSILSAQTMKLTVLCLCLLLIYHRCYGKLETKDSQTDWSTTKETKETKKESPHKKTKGHVENRKSWTLVEGSPKCRQKQSLRRYSQKLADHTKKAYSNRVCNIKSKCVRRSKAARILTKFKGINIPLKSLEYISLQ